MGYLVRECMHSFNSASFPLQGLGYAFPQNGQIPPIVNFFQQHSTVMPMFTTFLAPGNPNAATPQNTAGSLTLGAIPATIPTFNQELNWCAFFSFRKGIPTT